MKLYLCSYRIQLPDVLAELLGKPLAGARVAVIPNAKDYYADRARAFKIGQMHEYLQQLGLAPTTVDLRNYADGRTLLDKLKTFDMAWVAGGNTFCLRYEMQRSGFDTIVRELLDHVVYAGESAGALVMGTSLAGIEAADVPEFSERVIMNGLGIMPKFILPHGDSEYFAEANAQARQIHAVEDILSINDNQAYIVNGSEAKLLTATSTED